MTNLKKYSMRLAYTFLSLGFSVLFITTLYYFNLINENTYKVFKIVVLIINLFISGFILGREAKSKGFLEGIKLGLMIIPIFLIVTLLIKEPLKLTVILYYLIILITSTFGSMIGMSLKKETKS